MVNVTAGRGRDPNNCPYEWPHSMSDWEGIHWITLLGTTEISLLSDTDFRVLFQWLTATISKGNYPQLSDSSFIRAFTANSSSDEKSNCFIATAVYGEDNAPELELFRHFRDEFLLKEFAGRAFVVLYYSFSPYVAKLIRKSESLKRLTETFVLNPALCLIRLLMN